MLFDDLFSCVKGPGVIGTIMAFIVFLGFGFLFMLALDSESQGGEKSLAFIVRETEKDIEGTRSLIYTGEASLQQIPHLEKTVSAVNRANSRNESLTAEISSMNGHLPTLKEDKNELLAKWENYKNQFRTYIRSAAVGTLLPELKTTDGKIYLDVVISKVTAIGIHIRYKDGLSHIKFQALPEDIQEYYQYDKDQMLSETKRIAEVSHSLNKAAAAAHAVNQAASAVQKDKDKKAERDKTIVRIAMMEAQANALTGRISQLENDIVSAHSAASSARAAGRIHLSNVGSLRGQLSQKRAELLRARMEIVELKASL